MLITNQTRRPIMIRNLIRYGGYTLATLVGLSDQQIEDMASRLKHQVVVSDSSFQLVEARE